MSLPALLRPPLVWLAVAEAIAVVVLTVVAWNVWSSRQGAPPAAAAAPVASPPAGATEGIAGAPTEVPSPTGMTASPEPGPTPGLRSDPDFLLRQFHEINRVETTLHEVQWRIIKALVDAIQRYLEGVVLPAVEDALGGAGGT